MKLEEMNRKEWKAYRKRMEKIKRQYENLPDDFTAEEINEITEYLLESTRRCAIQTGRNLKLVIVFAGVAIVFQIVTLIFCILKKVI